MSDAIFRFEFEPSVPFADTEMSLHLAMFAVEGLFGRARVRLDAEYHIDELARAIVIDGTTDMGSLVVRVFTGLLIREFGEDAFEVHRVNSRPNDLNQEKELRPHEVA